MKLPQQDIKELYDSLGISVKYDWCINNRETRQFEAQLTFTRSRTEITVTYTMVYGHFWAKSQNGTYRRSQAGEYVYVRDVTGTQDDEADVSKLLDALDAKTTAKYVKAEEIFANTCRDAITAMDDTPEEWCKQFYGNEDSHKGHVMHTAQLNQYVVLSRMIGRDNVEKFGKLYAQL